jgi:V-type H+-transporting ATPase subunit C
LTLSDALPKIDAQFTGTVSKCLDTLRSLTDPKELGQHARINDRPLDEYILPLPAAWRWDAGRWGGQGKVHEVVEALTAVCTKQWAGSLAEDIVGKLIV